jgi:ribosomal protein L11 methyltransferase
MAAFYFCSMKYIQIQIEANEFQQEELIALLDDYGANGFEQTDDILTAYFEETEFAAGAIFKLLEGFRYHVTNLEEQNWNAVWEQNFQPVVVDDFCSVRAHFHEPVGNVKHEILITPKMSFGTGHHATTYMMMQQMRDMDFAGKKVFDFGTGTGILSILARKLGASAITAIDVDDWSIENAIENFERNNCNDVSIKLTSFIPAIQVDIILANINRNVILAYMEQLVNTILPGGFILFSGLLVADEEAIRNSAETQGLKAGKRLERQGWLSILCTKPKSS